MCDLTSEKSERVHSLETGPCERVHALETRFPALQIPTAEASYSTNIPQILTQRDDTGPHESIHDFIHRLFTEKKTPRIFLLRPKV